MASTPTASTRAENVLASVVGHFPVRSRASTWKARSFGMKAVSATLPSVSRPTGLVGLASSTASTASVTMS